VNVKVLQGSIGSKDEALSTWHKVLGTESSNQSISVKTGQDKQSLYSLLPMVWSTNSTNDSCHLILNKSTLIPKFNQYVPKQTATVKVHRLATNSLVNYIWQKKEKIVHRWKA